MAFWDGAGQGIISGIGNAIGGYFQAEAQKEANDTNQRIAAMNNQLTLELANSAHQREVKDLVAAGLNPVLSVDGAGAPVPALTSARVESTMKDNVIGNAVNSAIESRNQAKRVALEEKRLKKELDIADAELEGKMYENQLLKGEAFDGALTSDAWRNMSDDERQDVIRLRMEGIKAEAKDKTNINWRNNLRAFGDGVNSAVRAGSSIFRRK